MTESRIADAETGSSPFDSATAAQSTARPIGRRVADRIVGSSELLRASVDRATRAARSDEAVLLVGPPGSGRAHLGRAIHAWSARAAAPFIEFAATAVPTSEQAEELLGREGALVRAGAGTLLITALDRLDPAVREALLAALEAGSFAVPGDGEARPLRARVLATASDALAPSWPWDAIEVPDLDLRREDIPALAAHFLAAAASEAGLAPIGFTAEARRWLVAEPWPGQVRELRERVRNALRLAGSGAISIEALLLSNEGDEIPSFKEAKRGFETRYVETLLRRCGGNISRAARLAKKDRKDFYDVIRRTGVNPQDFRS